MSSAEHTVEAHDLEHGYLELPVISNSNNFSLDVTFLQSFTVGYLKPLPFLTIFRFPSSGLGLSTNIT